MTDSRKLALDANRRLAGLLGWTNIVDVGNALLGKPTWVCDNSRDQVKIPDWAGDWACCGPLIAEYLIEVTHVTAEIIHMQEVSASIKGWKAAKMVGCMGQDWNPGTRLCIVNAVCTKLEADQ